MNFDWEDFLSLAHELANPPSGDRLREAKARTAVSRAYYAAFHHARAYYRTRYDREPPGSGTGKEHHLLPQTLMDSGVPSEQTAADALRELRGMRRTADYRVLRRPRDLAASASLHLARDIIDILQA